MNSTGGFEAAGHDDLPDRTSYHVMWSDSGEVMLFLRLRTEGGSVHGESYQRNNGWVEDSRAFDVYTNGQDYDLVDAVEAEDLVRGINAGSV